MVQQTEIIMRTLLSTATMLAMMSGLPVIAQELRTVKSVDVTTELTAVQNTEAAAYWATLDTDLEAAIAERLVNRLGASGVEIIIDVAEIELANAFQELVGTDDTMLGANVRIQEQSTNANDQNFDLAVNLNQIVPMLPVGTDLTIVPASNAEVYAKLVGAFADAVVARIDN